MLFACCVGYGRHVCYTWVSEQMTGGQQSGICLLGDLFSFETGN